MSTCPILASLRRFAVALAAVLGMSPAVAGELTVSAAASLTDAFKEIAASFEKQHPSTTVRLNFAASGVLLQQIARGAPVDVFASADLATMDRAQSQGLIVVPQRRNFAVNTLVLIVPIQGGNIAALDDLTGSSVQRIAVGNPESVPVGRYTRIALTRAKLRESLAPKWIQAQSVRQVLDYVARGEVDAGFVYATDAALMKDKVRTTLTVALDDPVTYPIAPVAAAADPATAKVFVDYVTGPEAQAILARFGFSNP